MLKRYKGAQTVTDVLEAGARELNQPRRPLSAPTDRTPLKTAHKKCPAGTEDAASRCERIESAEETIEYRTKSSGRARRCLKRQQTLERPVLYSFTAHKKSQSSSRLFATSANFGTANVPRHHTSTLTINAQLDIRP
eukprot:GHVN01106225.1.p1 GENE.GHVN01106225.1~~GHVN01106225.1.p1  ORF type:complete len:137 (-),score=8.78 GHVN01106225.1:70-480(-)